MKLIKINTDYYIIVDDSEIKEGNWLYSFDNGIIVQASRSSADIINSKSLNGRGYAKITHSTKVAIEDYWNVIELPLSEVKELIGEKSWKGYIGGTEWEVEFVEGKLKIK